MPKFAKILLIALVVLVVLGLGFAGFLWFFSRNKVPQVNINQPVVNQPIVNTSNNNQPIINVNTNLPPPATDSKSIAEARAKRFAMFFAEKFGTFSSQGNFENLTELYDSMTSKMRSWAQAQVKSQWRLEDPYSGVTTRALNAQITSGKITDNQIEITVNTQKENRTSETSSSTSYEALRLVLVKSGDGWLVDAAFWQK